MPHNSTIPAQRKGVSTIGIDDLTPYLGWGRPCDASEVHSFVCNNLASREAQEQYMQAHLALWNNDGENNLANVYEGTLKLTAQTLGLDEAALLNHARNRAESRWCQVKAEERSTAANHPAAPGISLPRALKRPHVSIGNLKGADGNIYTVRGLVETALHKYGNTASVINSYKSAVDTPGTDYRKAIAISALYLGLDVDTVLAQVAVKGH